MKRTYLLPHVCQRIGVWLGMTTFAAALLTAGLSSAGILSSGTEVPDGGLSHAGGCISMLFRQLLIAAVLLITFSCEREEDEMIADVRKRAITHTAYAVFLLHIVTALLWNGCEMIHNLLHPASLWQEYPIELFRQLALATKDPLVVFLLYQAVLRTRLAKLKQALKNEA